MLLKCEQKHLELEGCCFNWFVTYILYYKHACHVNAAPYHKFQFSSPNSTIKIFLLSLFTVHMLLLVGGMGVEVACIWDITIQFVSMNLTYNEF